MIFNMVAGEEKQWNEENPIKEKQWNKEKPWNEENPIKETLWDAENNNLFLLTSLRFS